jgi:hypothetical protein
LANSHHPLLKFYYNNDHIIINGLHFFLETLHQHQTDEQLQQILSDANSPQKDERIDKLSRWSKLWSPKNKQLLVTAIENDVGEVAQRNNLPSICVGIGGTHSPERQLTLQCQTH